MRVLINGFDLYRSVGGGQTFYRGVIARNPQIDFFYLREHEQANAPRPANAHPLPLRPFCSRADLAGFAEPGPPAWAHHDFVDAANVAAAAAGMHFDVLDTPDYSRAGVFLPAALGRVGASVGKVALSMHGAISTTVALNWGADGRAPLWLTRLEQLQYAAADLRYFISPSYRDEWAAKSALPSHPLDPMWSFTPPAPRPYAGGPAAPELHFIGRTERRKGPHYFLHLLWWLPHGSYSAASVIGPDCADAFGVSSSDHLRPMIAARRLDGVVNLVPAKSADELAALFASKAVVVVPSQYDTLNLVALESLFAGCPTVVGSGAGVCRYLRERFPGVPFYEFDVTNFYGELPRLERYLAEYDRHRAELEAAVRAADLSPSGPGLESIYRAESVFDPAARLAGAEWEAGFAGALAAVA